MVSEARLDPVGTHTASTPIDLPAKAVTDIMPALKHESPMPWATTMGRLPFATASAGTPSVGAMAAKEDEASSAASASG